MAKITINGKDLEVEDGKNLVDAAEENGVDIPHYCYHPGLSIAGQCRMCVVEQEGNPKLQIACNMKCQDGLKITTNSPKVEQAVQANLEFHLINHPIDCPICDQAGECGLQDYYMEHGKYRSQMRETKVNKEKVVALGEKITLDKERCILCSRCVRFTQEVSKTADLAIFNRGDRSVIGTVNNEPMKGNYQVNTVDICPVGALTSTDFRFEQRVWFLEEAESVCHGCSTGCNVNVHHKSGKHIYRLKPRYNKEVNSHWMCDQGRLTYKTSNYDARLTTSRLGGVKVPMSEVLQMWASELKTLIAMEQQDEIGVFVTPHHTHEELDSIFDVLKEQFQITQFFSENISKMVEEDKVSDELMMRSDPYPNSHGFLRSIKSKQIKLQGLEDLQTKIKAGSIKHIIIFAPEGDRALKLLRPLQSVIGPDQFIVLITPQVKASELFPQALAIPSISHYEKKGRITNFEGREQELKSEFKMFKGSISIQELMNQLSQEYRRPIEGELKRGGQQ